MTLNADILLEQVRKVIKYLFEGEREKLLLRRKKYLEKKNLLGKRRAETFRKTNEALMKFINSKDSSEFGKYFYKQDGDVILFFYIRFKEFEEELIGTPKDKTLVEFGSDILQYDDLKTYPVDHPIFQTVHQKIFFYGFFSHKTKVLDSLKSN